MDMSLRFNPRIATKVLCFVITVRNGHLISHAASADLGNTRCGVSVDSYSNKRLTYEATPGNRSEVDKTKEAWRSVAFSSKKYLIWGTYLQYMHRLEEKNTYEVIRLVCTGVSLLIVTMPFIPPLPSRKA